MKGKLSVFAILILIGSLVLAGCAQQAAAPEQSSGGGGEVTALIGFTASQTGKYNVESTRQI